MTAPTLTRAAAGLDWRDEALCSQTDPELFYPLLGDHGAAARAKSICARCPVLAECRDDALARDEQYGIWGGMSEQDRRKHKKAVAA